MKFAKNVTRSFLSLLCASQTWSTSFAHRDHDHEKIVSLHRLVQEEGIPVDCGTEDPTIEERIQAGQIVADWVKQGSNTRGKSYKVRVWFNVINNNDGSGDLVTDAMIDQYMGILNSAYSGTPFSFENQGIRQISNSAWHLCDEDVAIEFKSNLHVGGRNDMNVYFCDIQIPFITGWSTFSSAAGTPTDGIVLQSNYIKSGAAPGYFKRTVLPHEAGHWLGVYHTFQGECSDQTYGDSETKEYISGDGVPDTPAHWKNSSDCSIAADTCPNNVPNVDPGLDPLHNMMSYADDSCRTEFTSGQISRMVAMYEYWRFEGDLPPDDGQCSKLFSILCK